MDALALPIGIINYVSTFKLCRMFSQKHCNSVLYLFFDNDVIMASRFTPLPRLADRSPAYVSYANRVDFFFIIKMRFNVNLGY